MDVQTGSERSRPSQELTSYCSGVTSGLARSAMSVRSVRKPRAVSAGTRGWSTQYTSIALSFAESRSWSESLSWSGGTGVYAIRSPGRASSKPRITGAKVSAASGPRNCTVVAPSVGRPPEHPASAAAETVPSAAPSRLLRLRGRVMRPSCVR